MVIFREAAGPCTVDNKTRCKNRKLLQNEVNSKTGTVTSPKCVWILAPWGPKQSHGPFGPPWPRLCFERCILTLCNLDQCHLEDGRMYQASIPRPTIPRQTKSIACLYYGLRVCSQTNKLKLKIELSNEREKQTRSKQCPSLL